METRSSRLVFALAAACLSSAALWADDALETSDTYISSATPTVNSGALANLNVGGGSSSLIRFDLSQLPSGTTATNVQQAILYLWVNRVGTSGSVDIAQVTSPWAENSVTFNTAPTIGAVQGTIPVSAAGQWETIDLTTLVKIWVTNGASNDGVTVTASLSVPTTVVFLDSKENTSTSHPPRLDVVLGSVGPQNNTTVGGFALPQNTTGFSNTAVGYSALYLNTTGFAQTAIGAGALFSNTTGFQNTAVGVGAMYANTTGLDNVAVGLGALEPNTTGNYNTAVGEAALTAHTTGDGNTALGFYALGQDHNDLENTGVGDRALENLTGGSNNIAVGSSAGTGISSLSNNIDIGNPGTPSDNSVIRIGTGSVHQLVFIAGVRGVTTGQSDAVPVVIDSNSQLGTTSSSRRFKEDIQDMGDASSGLMRLRPVTYRYKQPYNDGAKPIQFGLIAEEVDEVYPEIVAHSADGFIETVQYDKVNAMLLNEVQRQERKIQAQDLKMRSQEEEIQALKASLAGIRALVEGRR